MSESIKITAAPQVLPEIRWARINSPNHRSLGSQETGRGPYAIVRTPEMRHQCLRAVSSVRSKGAGGQLEMKAQREFPLAEARRLRASCRCSGFRRSTWQTFRSGFFEPSQAEHVERTWAGGDSRPGQAWLASTQARNQLAARRSPTNA